MAGQTHKQPVDIIRHRRLGENRPHMCSCSCGSCCRQQGKSFQQKGSTSTHLSFSELNLAASNSVPTALPAVVLLPLQGVTWTRVAATVLAGSSSITLQEAVQWKAGDAILLVTTTWKGESYQVMPNRTSLVHTVHMCLLFD